MKRLLSTLAVASCLITGIPMVTMAQGLPGFTLLGGPEQGNRLNYRLDYGNARMWDRYRLRLPSKKLNLAIATISITYPNYYKGEFDTKSVQVKVKGKSVPLQEVIWDKENRFLEIYPQEPIPAGNNVEIVLSNVKNPDYGGMYNFNARIRTPGDVPLFRYIGTWQLTIN